VLGGVSESDLERELVNNKTTSHISQRTKLMETKGEVVVGPLPPVVRPI
jgi:hypothetical protein